jgi:hypothetical protein
VIDLKEIKEQIEHTLAALSIKQQVSNEPVVDQYAQKYNEVLSLINSGEDKEKVISLAKNLSGLARGYLETSSNYQQDFLVEMGKTEKLLKQL